MGSRVSGLLSRARAVAARASRRLARAPLAGAAATLTFFAGIALVPWLLLAIWSTTWYQPAEVAERRWDTLAALVPPEMGGREPYADLVHAGAQLGPATALVLVFPASLYGEGLRRAALLLTPRRGPRPETRSAARGRLRVLPLLAVVPPLTWLALPLAEGLVPLAPGGADGVGETLARVYLGFHVLWLGLALPVAWVLRVVVPEPSGWPAALLGGLGIAAFLAGFLHGFLLFLAIPLDVGLPFAGLGVVGGVVAVGLWLYLLHAVLLAGYVVVREACAEPRRGGG